MTGRAAEAAGNDVHTGVEEELRSMIIRLEQASVETQETKTLNETFLVRTAAALKAIEVEY